jgi:hypothetical protein
LLPGLFGTYYNSPDLSGPAVLTLVSPQLSFGYGGGTVDPAVKHYESSASWSGFITAPTSDTYYFGVDVDQAAKVWVNGQLVCNNWDGQGSNWGISLTAGQRYSFQAQYRQTTDGNSSFNVRWFPGSNWGAWQTVPASAFTYDPSQATPVASVAGPVESSNASTTLNLDALAGSWVLDGGYVRGGTIVGTNGDNLIASSNGGTLDGMTLNTNFDLTASYGNVTVVDGLTLNGTATLGSYARIYFGNTETLGGTGTVVFNNGWPQGLIANATNMTLTIGAGITICGGNQQGGDPTYGSVIGYSNYWGGGSNASIVNLGTISTDTLAQSAVVLSASNYWSAWPAPSSGGKWLCNVDNWNEPTGQYVYTTTFDLTGFDPSTAVLTGTWTCDNDGSICLNGHSTGISTSASLDSHGMAFD